MIQKLFSEPPCVSGSLKSKTSPELCRRINNPKWPQLVALVVTVAMCGAVVAEAQQQAKVAKIGWLVNRPASGPGSGSEVIRRELLALGYSEGKNIASEYRYAEGIVDRLPALAEELVRLKVDIIFTFSTPAARAAKNATRTIPIVFLAEGDPVVAGLVDSLPRPGGNITGFTTISPVIAGKRLELLKETVPKLSRITVLWTRGGSDQSWKESQLAARELGLQIHSMEVSSADKLESAFKEAVKAASGALAVTPYHLTNSNRKLIADLAARHRLPAIYPRGDIVDSGGLMSYGADRTEPYRRVAVFVDKILKGTKPADIPVEQPMRFKLVLNLKTAKALGLTIPPIVLMRVTRVVK
ncbi:MAG: ABC transporter substrate-binding protein [Deltaproteobacteria bacterium]|nr:ABC transporter substrate-binding protein [Deltaproteobacteria bacterium]